jgi:hypothetical protein
MAVSLDNAIRDEPERFVDHAFRENPDIKNLEDFRIALKNAFDTERGKRAGEKFDETIIVDLFESSECDKRLRENVGDKEADRLRGEVKRGEFELIHDGTPKFIFTPKAFKISGYSRKGKTISGYNKGYRKWTKAEVKFLQVRKAKKISPKQILYDYSDHFKENQRSSSSLKTKIYRI